MALPPDNADSFIREVDENLRRDQAADFARKYGKLVAVAVTLFLLAVAGVIYWRHQQQQVAEAQGEKLAATIRAVGEGNSRNAAGELDAVADASKGATEASARMARAALALQQNDRKTAIAGYRAIADDKGLPQPYRDLSLIRATALEFDSLSADDVIARMAPLAKAESAWFGSAGELTVLAMLKKGDQGGAGALAKAIAEASDVPPSLKARMNDLATTLAVGPAAPAAPAAPTR